MDCSPPSSSVHGISHAKILEWVAMPSSRGSSWPRDQTQLSHIAGGFFTVCTTREDRHPSLTSVQLLSGFWLFTTPWTTAHQASLSITNSQSSPKLMYIESVMPSSRYTCFKSLSCDKPLNTLLSGGFLKTLMHMAIMSPVNNVLK